MADLYKGRAVVYDHMKARFSALSDSEFSFDVDLEEEERRKDFPEKDILESGLSKADFWAGKLQEMQIEEEEEPDGESRVEEPAEPYQTKAPRSKGGRRYIRILVRVAAAAAIVLGVFLFTANSGSDRFHALMISPGVDNTTLDDFHRGILAGRANISFAKTAKGEPLWVFSSESKAAKDKNYTLETGLGNEFILKLPDGSQVWMNALSSISFPANFSKDNIYLKLQGEAYFETVPNPTKHFIITTVNSASGGPGRQPPTANGQQSTVNELQLQTSASHFILTAYSGDSLIRAGILSGKARVQWADQSAGQSLELQAGQQASFINGKRSGNTVADDAEIMALKNGEIYFREAPIQSIMATVAKWYPVHTRYEGGIPAGRYSLRVPVDAGFSVITDSLKQQGVHLVVQGKTISISK